MSTSLNKALVLLQKKSVFMTIAAGIVLTTVVTTTLIFSDANNVIETSTPFESVERNEPLLEKIGLIDPPNPLLEKSKENHSSFFPSFCFPEIYFENPSYDGGLVKNCKVNTVINIKNATGIELSVGDITSDEVIANLKQLYGEDRPWRKQDPEADKKIEVKPANYDNFYRWD